MFCNIHGLISIVSGDADYVIHACLKIEVKVCAYYDVTNNRQATEQVPHYIYSFNLNKQLTRESILKSVALDVPLCR